MQIDKLIQIDPNQFNIFSSQYIYKKLHLKYLFLIKLYFYWLSKLFKLKLNQSNAVTSFSSNRKGILAMFDIYFHTLKKFDPCWTKI
jgi:hypothetical protein